MEEFKECPYCSEKILSTAKKCRYCGEWLTDDVSSRKGSQSKEKGSADARAVKKGIKEKEGDDITLGCSGIIILVIAIAIGSFVNRMTSGDAGFIVGIIVFVVGAIIAGQIYYKE